MKFSVVLLCFLAASKCFGSSETPERKALTVEELARTVEILRISKDAPIVNLGATTSFENFCKLTPYMLVHVLAPWSIFGISEYSRIEDSEARDETVQILEAASLLLARIFAFDEMKKGTSLTVQHLIEDGGSEEQVRSIDALIKGLFEEQGKVLPVDMAAISRISDYLLKEFVPKCEKVILDSHPKTGTFPGQIKLENLKPYLHFKDRPHSKGLALVNPAYAVSSILVNTAVFLRQVRVNNFVGFEPLMMMAFGKFKTTDQFVAAIFEAASNFALKQARSFRY